MSASSDSSKARGYFDSFSKSAESEFMPETAGAALQDSPRWSRITVWLAAALLISALVWAKFAVLQEVTMGEGKAIPSSKVQVIQNLEGGIVTEIFVREGQMVNKGDTLLRLDDTRFLSNKGESEADRYALTAQVERLSAEAEGRPFKLSARSDRQGAASGRRRTLAVRTAATSTGQRTTHPDRTTAAKNPGTGGVSLETGQYSSSLALLQPGDEHVRAAGGTGAVSPVEILRLKRSAVEIRGSLNATTLAIPRAESAINEIKSKIDESEQSFRSDAAKELNEKRTDLSKITASSIAIDDRVTRTTVVSPVKGIIKMLKVNTIGGVVQPGSDMVEIVPLEDNLLIEAKVRPQDVAFLHPGQKAMVKFSAYDYTIYGGLECQAGADRRRHHHR